jgi:micrococcal nuclease
MRAGSYASLTVNVTSRSRCTIQVIYDTVVSQAKGLGPKTGGRITWRWRVGTSTHPGSWPIIVKCGKAGTLRTKIRLLPR